MLPTSYGRDSPQGGTSRKRKLHRKKSVFKRFFFCLASFPIRENYELRPGMKSRDKNNPNETF